MHRIKDKKRWWVANFCTPHVKCAPNRMLGLGLGVGLVGCLVMALTFALLVSAVVPQDTDQRFLFAGILLSDTLKQLRTAKAEEADAKGKQAQLIYTKAQAEKRKPTDDEVRAFDGLMAEVEASANEIKKLDTQIEAQLKVEETMRGAAAPARPNPTQDSGITDRATGIYRPIAQVRHSERPRNFGLPTREAQDSAYRAGMWARAVIYGDQKAAAWCADHGVPIIKNALSEGTNSAGGFLVPDEYESAIIDLREKFGVFRTWANPKQMASDHTTRPRRTGGLTAYAVGENAEITASDKTWDNVTLTAKKWGVLTRYSSELSEDAVISIADDLASEIAYAFASSEDDAGFNGTGAATYHGIVGVRTKLNTTGIGGSQGAGSINAASGHDTFAEIDGDDLDLVVAALPEYARMNAKWYCSTVAKSLVFDPLMRAAGGNSKMDVAGRMMDNYLGYPIVISQKMPTSTADISDTVMILFGDMAQAVTFGTRRGITIAVDGSRYFELDQLAIRGTERFDINVHDVGDTSTAGPLVALVGE